MNPYFRGIFGVIATYSAGVIGLLFVDTTISSWYAALAKPRYMPPDWAFAPIWMVMYAFAAAALIMIWTMKPETPEAETWARFYFVQLFFNAAWVMFFFGFHAFRLSFVEILVYIFLSICLTINAFELNKRAGVLLLPYVGWLIYAGLLNGMIWYMN